MTIEDLHKSLEMMIDIPEGSKFREILEKAAARQREEAKP
jgi:hypothetical protein